MPDLYWCAGSRCAWCAGELPPRPKTHPRRVPPPGRDETQRTSWLVDPPPEQKKPKKKLSKREKRWRRRMRQARAASPKPLSCPRCVRPLRPVTTTYRAERPDARCAGCGARWIALSGDELAALSLDDAHRRASCPSCRAPMRSATVDGQPTPVDVCVPCRRMLALAVTS